MSGSGDGLVALEGDAQQGERRRRGAERHSALGEEAEDEVVVVARQAGGDDGEGQGSEAGHDVHGTQGGQEGVAVLRTLHQPPPADHQHPDVEGQTQGHLSGDDCGHHGHQGRGVFLRDHGLVLALKPVTSFCARWSFR